MINKFTPVASELVPLVDHVRAILTANGETDAVGAVIKNMQANAQMQAIHGIDSWLSYGAYLPAVERVIALHAGEDESRFLGSYPVPG